MPDLILRKTEVQCYGKLRFWSEETPKYTIKVAQGFLGKSNADKRSRKAHEAISKGSGDHAGHLIARRFGGPDAACNLARQNYMQNRGGGTYYTVEDIWAEALDDGAEVYVTVREKYCWGRIVPSTVMRSGPLPVKQIGKPTIRFVSSTVRVTRQERQLAYLRSNMTLRPM